MTEIRYKCKCMNKERSIIVTDRVSKSDIADWMENVVQSSVGYDHRARNPLCRNKETEFIKIPMSDEDIDIEIGVPRTHN